MLDFLSLSFFHTLITQALSTGSFALQKHTVSVLVFLVSSLGLRLMESITPDEITWHLNLSLLLPVSPDRKFAISGSAIAIYDK